jgi:RHS repeat-associated protein
MLRSESPRARFLRHCDSYAFTGREWDPETGLYYYRARYYDPGVGRFPSQDPAGLRAGPNFYAYARNNPVKFADPSGLDVINKSGCIAWVKDEDTGSVFPVQPCETWVGTHDGVAVPGRAGTVFKTPGKLGGQTDVIITESKDVVPTAGHGPLIQGLGGGWKDETWHQSLLNAPTPDRGWDLLFLMSYAKPVCPCKCK